MTTDFSASEHVGWLPDGRLSVILRQSHINTFQQCPEKLRQQLLFPTEQTWTDLTALGTAVHAGIEYALVEQRDREMVKVDEAYEVAVAELAQIGTWTQTRFHEERVYDMAGVLLQAWFDVHYGTYEPARVEQTFRQRLYSDDRMLVSLTGTPDVEDADGIVHDHKTASRAYSPDAWQRQRWAVQPTAYLWAAHVREHGDDEPMPTRRFQYDVMVHNGTAESVPITRDHTHVDWMRQQARQIGVMLLADIAPWPQIDSGWWCSDKWCETFAAGACKGAFMDADRWLRPQLEDVTTEEQSPLEEAL